MLTLFSWSIWGIILFLFPASTPRFGATTCMLICTSEEIFELDSEASTPNSPYVTFDIYTRILNVHTSEGELGAQHSGFAKWDFSGSIWSHLFRSTIGTWSFMLWTISMVFTSYQEFIMCWVIFYDYINFKQYFSWFETFMSLISSIFRN